MINNICFYKLKDNYYCNCNGIKYDLNEENLSLFKENMQYPCRIGFYRCSKKITSMVINYLSGNNISVKVNSVYRYDDRNDIGVQFILSKPYSLRMKNNNEK